MSSEAWRGVKLAGWLCIELLIFKRKKLKRYYIKVLSEVIILPPKVISKLHVKQILMASFEIASS